LNQCRNKSLYSNLDSLHGWRKELFKCLRRYRLRLKDPSQFIIGSFVLCQKCSTLRIGLLCHHRFSFLTKLKNLIYSKHKFLYMIKFLTRLWHHLGYFVWSHSHHIVVNLFQDKFYRKKITFNIIGGGPFIVKSGINSLQYLLSKNLQFDNLCHILCLLYRNSVNPRIQYHWVGSHYNFLKSLISQKVHSKCLGKN
jgi:hypothetical protein